MHRLRLWALAWFSLFVVAAAAAPLVQPQRMELVCMAAGGVKLLVHGSDALDAPGMRAMECALCLPVHAPPCVASAALAPAPPLAHPPLFLARTLVAAAPAPVPPARGPPFSLSPS
ncbi:hypothetical protein [Acidovorax sp. SRB_24]|uniref:hypothetical protein n=1 Tax=Acidovorax sp. SRB_24 TaxID=1962700 RepID=UPI001F0F79A8|nr:hypothetical protein [Acidovorax sp. SRB_24]